MQSNSKNHTSYCEWQSLKLVQFLIALRCVPEMSTEQSRILVVRAKSRGNYFTPTSVSHSINQSINEKATYTNDQWFTVLEIKT